MTNCSLLDRFVPLLRVLAALSVVLWFPSTAHAQTEAVEYYGLDALGSVRVVFDANGNVVGRMDYGPFGQELFPSTGKQQGIYAGLFADGESGLDHAAARSYQVRTGRFSTLDPVYGDSSDPQGWNRYTYALNSPLKFSDPSGLLPGYPCDPREFVCPYGPEEYPGGIFGDQDTGRSDRGGPSRRVPPSTPPTVPPTNPPPPSPPPNPPPPPPPPPPTACENYTEFLTYTAASAGAGPAVMNAGAHVAAGVGLMGMGYFDTIRGSTSGFKSELTFAGQGDDVYRHVNFVSGATISGYGLLAVGAVLVDLKQVIVDRRRQSIAELAGDMAGFHVAAAYMQATFTKDYRTFKKQVTRTLCKPK